MAAVAENGFGSDDQFIHQSVTVNPSSDSKSEFQRDVQKLVDLLSKLNPSAKEFFPSSYSPDHQFPPDNLSGDYRRKRNNYNQGRRRLNGRTIRAQREDSIRRTVYVSDIDQHSDFTNKTPYAVQIRSLKSGLLPYLLIVGK
ncbi:hypothetical protein HHK36_003495 [Tetracentron sinense]|uniref:Ataxin-2 C-terminal domain-containing protein n=1 Tax=Tetracentron sinense TaxID=13715 RepID=A0A835DP07_TETSI|nr:hypothetical protein HHK36_003495 [Tetracentron sinense]